MTGVKTEVEEEDTSEEEKARQERIKNKPPITECLSLYDFEVRCLSLGRLLRLVDEQSDH